MIHVFVGTKAQFIKMAPIMQELDRRSIAYNFIDTGQHAGLTGDLTEQFGLRQPDVFLRERMENIDTLFQALVWTIDNLCQIALKRRQICERIFRGEGGICLIHGDTLTTLLSLLYAKRCGLKVAHVEAGLRSYHLLNPFPEEIIRLIAMRYSDILFAPSEWAFDNLLEMGYGDKAVDAGGNTIVDAIRYAKEHIKDDKRPSVPYVVATTHRVETIYSRSRLEMMVELLERIAIERQVLFVLHEPTRQQLNHFNLHERLSQNPSIKLLPLQPYLAFVNLLAGADFIVTDGGSIQEESYLLGVPCLIMRSRTERLEGLGNNAYLADFDRDRVEDFLDRWPTISHKSAPENSRPASKIVEFVLEDTSS
jgi:UDP-N-acetylglucosamine 2-epimerase (non-hydrolysing)